MAPFCAASASAADVGGVTSAERIGKMSTSTSASWTTKKEEVEGRAAIHNSQCRKYSNENALRFADHTVSQEQLDTEKAAKAKRKLKQDSELDDFANARNVANCAQPNAAKPSQFQAAAGAAKPDIKQKKVPGLVVVKRQKVGDPKSEATDAAPAQDNSPQGAKNGSQAADPAAPKEEKEEAGTGLGLGDYGSSSDEDDDADALPAPAL